MAIHQWIFRVFLAVFLFSSACFQGSNAARRTKRFIRIFALPGSSIELTCPQHTTSQPASLWRISGFNTMIRLRPDGIIVEQNGPKFTIYNVTTNLQGMYMCRSGRSRRPLGTVYMTQPINNPPITTVTPQKVIITGQQKSATLKCVAVGDKINSVVWFKAGSRVSSHNQTVSKQTQGTATKWTSILQLDNITKQDDGKYECRVLNTNRDYATGFWPASSVVMVTDSSCLALNGNFTDPANKEGYVECINGVGSRKNCTSGKEWDAIKKTCENTAAKIYWLRESPSMNFIDKKTGQSIVIDCQLSTPDAEVQLYQKTLTYERRVPDGCKITYFNQTFTIHALIIFDVGRYFCEAEKIQTKRELYLNVIPGLGTVWGTGSVNFILPLNSSIDLECRASIVPGSEISLELSTMYSKTTLNPDGKSVIKRGNTFTIRGIDRDKRGTVFCKTTSRCGGQATGYKIGRLLPVLLPDEITPKPLIKPSTHVVSDQCNAAFTYYCTTGPAPVKTLEWFLDGKVVKDNRISYSKDGRNSSLTLRRKDCLIRPTCSIECRVTSNQTSGYWFSTAELQIKREHFELAQPKAIKEYTTANINCSMNSTLIFQGRYNTRRPDGVKIKWSGDSFHIELFDRNDTGKYYCSKDDENPSANFTIIGLPYDASVQIAPPNETTIEFSAGINLVCYTSYPSLHLNWTKTNSKGERTAITGATQSPRLDGIQSVLEIRNANKNDEGVYTCSSRVGRVLDTASVKINVKDFSVPTVSAKPSKIIANETTNINLTCTVSGSPLPSVVWTKNGKQIAKCRPFYGSVLCTSTIPEYNASYMAGSFTLMIRNVTYGRDDTEYECSAANEAGKAKASIKVAIYVKPQLLKTSSGIHYMVAKPSENVHLECTKQRGYPAPSYTWHQAPSSICQGRIDDCKPLAHQWKHSSLVNEIMTLPPMSNIMLYKCIASNAAGHDTKLFAVVRMDTKPPKITQYQTNITVKGSETLQVSCQVDGVPTPDVFWVKSNQTFAECTGSVLENSKQCKATVDTNAARFTVRWKGTHALLTVHSASHMYDGGLWTCLARSQVGKVEADLHVIVHESPKLVKQGEIASYFAAFGAQRSLVIDALSGNPQPHYKWYKQPADHCMTAQGVCKPRSRRWIESVDEVSPPPGVPSKQSIIALAPTKRNFFYKVEAVNHMGVDSQVFSVVRTVDKIRPEISTPEGRTVFDQYDTLKIQCKASLFDFDAVDIQRKDGRPLSNKRTKTFTKRMHDDIVMTMMIDSVALDDAGVYLCLGYTSNSTSDSEIDITVKAAIAPAVSLSNMTILSTIGQVSLYCHVTSGYPRPQITWYRNANIIKLKPLGTDGNCSSFANGFYHPHGLKTDNSEHLVICHPRHVENTGWYTCKANNVKGLSKATSYLNVHEAPTVRLKPDHSQIPVEYGQSLNVSCAATGNPQPAINWTVKAIDKDKHVAVNTEYVLGVTGGKNLYISSIDDDHYSEYICWAYNKYGTSTARFSLVNPYVLSAKQPPPREHLIAAALLATFFLIFVVIFGLILCRRKQMYGGFYLCTTPPLPDLIKSLDPTSPLIEQIHKLPYDPLWEYPRDNIVFGDVLGTGAFGKVYLAETEGCLIVDTSSVSSRHRLAKRKDYRRGSAAMTKIGTLKVAVKTLKENATESDHNDLLSELKILIHVGAHKNIVNLLGACTKGSMQDLWVIIEYCPHGDLLHFLKNKRHIHKPTWEPPTDDPSVQFSLTELVSAAYQVARGMEFLTSRLCIHRDLAARNVLVGENYVMKVADFGLARDVYRSEEYVKHTPGLVPIKWMALESLVDKVYSQKSDVWSFGILMWEIFTLGGNPYPELHPSEIYEYLVEGKRMPKPDNCPQEIYELMKDCWMHGPEDRPTFSELVLKLDKEIEYNMPAMGREAYLELDNVDELNDQNCNKEVDGYLQPTDVIITPKDPQSKTLSGNLPEPSHDYTEIPDVFPMSNGSPKSHDFDKADEKNHLIHKPLEYEMAMKSPRYVNIDDRDGCSTTML